MHKTASPDQIDALLKIARRRWDGTPAHADMIEIARRDLVTLALRSAAVGPIDPRLAEYRHPDNVRSYGDRTDPLVRAACDAAEGPWLTVRIADAL